MAAKATKKSGAALEKLRADIKSGSPENVYIFYGEETYLRDRYLEELKALLVPEGFEEFNYHRHGQLPPRQRQGGAQFHPLPEGQQHRVQQVRDHQGQSRAQNGAQESLAQKPLSDHRRRQRRRQKRQGIEARNDPRHSQVAQQAEDAAEHGPLGGTLQHGHDPGDHRRQKRVHRPHGDAVEHQGLHQHQQQHRPGVVQPFEEHIPLVHGLIHGRSSQSTMVKSVITNTSTSWVISVLGMMVA